jgi:serine/threonine protein kinase
MGVDAAGARPETVGDYELGPKVGEGGMGAVYRARHRLTGAIVAVKIMPAHMAANPVLAKRFEQEFRAASKLNHPNIVQALDYGDAPLGHYLVMEFVEGETLGQRVEREGAIPEAEAIRIIAQVAQGLHRAHKQNLVHRDVKPDNILLGPDGVAKLADLGLVKEADTDLNLTKTGRGLGTPHFMAPEQFRHAKFADPRCDIYSLGATLYQIVTGVLPFSSSNGPLDAWMKKINNELKSPRDLTPAISERLNWAILRAMSADPEKRPRTCREFVEDLTGHSTRKVPTVNAAAESADLWYLIYRDEEGGLHTVKGTTQAIRRSLKDGLLGDASNVRVSQSKTGTFQPLVDFAQFRDLLVGGGGGRSANRDTVPEASPTRQEKRPEPHISLRTSYHDDRSGTTVVAEMIKWSLLAIILAATAVGAFFLMESMKLW